jgi:prepilin-type N-terminal cleavage/methylation domain-containing protein
MIANVLRNQKGVTLVEMMIAASLAGLLAAGTGLFLQEGQAAYQTGTGRSEVQQNARVALDRLIRELRTGKAIINGTATSITFQYVDDVGGLPTDVTVQYSLNGLNLQRNQTVPVPATPQPETVIGGVTSLTLTYYDVNDQVTAVAANAFSVDVQIRTQWDGTVASSSMRNQRAFVENRVRLRNL